MKHQGHFARAVHLREATQTRSLIADLDPIVDILNGDISAEEQAAGVTDLKRPEYPIFARALRARRDNLMETIAALRRRLI